MATMIMTTMRMIGTYDDNCCDDDDNDGGGSVGW